MKNVYYKIVALICLVLSANMGKAQTMHVLIACDTNDPSIGTGVVVNMENLSRLAQEVIGVLDCESTITVYDAPKCTKENVMSWIKNLSVEPDDVVMFMYSGHGGRAINDNDPFSQMCMNNPAKQAGFLPVSHVDKWLEAKNPRLRIIITECCNSEDRGIKIKPFYAMAAGNYTEESSYNKKALRDLFFNAKGKVMITSSKASEYSWICTDPKGFGGYFVSNFIDSFNDAAKSGRLPATWNAIFNDVHSKVSQLKFNHDGRTYTQEPFAQISEKKSSDKDIDHPDKTKTGTLFESLQYLVNSNIPVDTRLAKISEIYNRHFTPEAKVLTIAANGKSIVDREDAMSFLKRITLSHNIKQISILNGDNENRNSTIKVHELRK